MQIGAATAELTQSLGRSPTPRELAEAIGCSVEEILEGIESSNAYSTLSLDATDDSDDGASSMLDALGVDDAGLEHVEIRESIKPLLERARPAREEDPAAAVLQEHDAVADRRGDRGLPDARLAAAHPDARRSCATPSRSRRRRTGRQTSGSSASASMLAGCSMPSSTDHRSHRQRDGDQRCTSRRFHASPSWISWVSRTDLAPSPAAGSAPTRRRAARRRRRGRRPTSRPPATSARGRCGAPRTAPMPSSTRPWMATREAATVRGGGLLS